MYSLRNSVVVAGCVLIVACAPISPRADKKLNRDVNCETAKRDIVILEEERASTTRKIANGVQSIVPVSAVIRLFQGEYVDGVRVASGSYNRSIENKIGEIKSTCGMG